jgi:histidyl-tRNA synthetase
MDADRIGDYMALAKKLREGLNPLGPDGRPLGPVIPVEMYQGNPKKFGKQLQYADRRGCPLAIIQGSDERERGKVQIKDLIEGRRQAAAIESHEEWREERPGQFEIDEADLVEEVRRVLAEQAADRANAG